MAETVTFKRGNTFAANCAWTPGAGDPANLLTTDLASSVKDACGNEYVLTVTKAGDGLSFVLSYPAGTSGWNTGLARWDIKLTYAGGITRTETLRINVVEEVTP